MAAESHQQTPFFMSLAGNIGVGKTTLTTKISERFGLEPYFEQVIKNPYLEDFYGDMDRWSFNLQVYFLSRRFMDQRTITNSPKPCVQDRSIYEDAEIFAHILHEQGNMSDRDYENYYDLFYAMTDYLKKPDLIVYLRATTWTLLTRIRKRGRDYEKSISKDYLYQLNNAYERWIASIQDKLNVLIIETDKLDYDKRPEDLEYVFQQIEPHMRGKIKVTAT